MKSLGLTAEFYFPIEDNDEISLTKEREQFEQFLAMHYGGYINKGLVSGYWIDEKTNEDYLDYHYILAVSSEKLSIKTIEALAREIKRTARQHAIYFKIDGKAYLKD